MIKKVFFLCLGVSIISCQKDDETIQSTSSQEFKTKSLNSVASVNDYTGEELFKAVIFANGEFASAIPTYADLVNEQRKFSIDDQQELDKKMEEMIISIQKEDPNFFDNFKTKIVSHDHLQIDEAFKIASIEISERMEILIPGFSKVEPLIQQDVADGNFETAGNLDPTKIQDKSDEYAKLLQDNNVVSAAPCSWAVACVAYFALAVHNTVGATVNIAAAINVYVWKAYKFWGAADPYSMQTHLQYETLVNEIASAK